MGLREDHAGRKVKSLDANQVTAMKYLILTLCLTTALQAQQPAALSPTTNVPVKPHLKDGK